VEEREEEEEKNIGNMIKKEEIRIALRSMKLKRAAGIDRISIEEIRKKRVMDKIGGPDENMEERNDPKELEKKHCNTVI